MKLPAFDTSADFNAEASENCGICVGPDKPGSLMLYAGTMTINLCPKHARAFARFIDQVVGQS